ncbi:hypothetical protein J4221_00810 [Candidatus Pacearchaeota archaeon]|nr:hypothetical protein [Candidatus Pacearchaeota archaeon]
MGKKIVVLVIGITIFIGILYLTFGSRVNGFVTISDYEGNMKIYKSGNCGCCSVYSNYFRGKGNSDVEIINLENLNSVKEQYEIPSSLESCHTTVIGNYFVEGHVPLEAVEKLMKEKPDIKGIAMPGMPSGSPGMTGAKKGDFVIYAVNNDGSYGEWMRI